MLDLIQGDAVLETARLRLEPLTPHHAPQLFPVLSDARIYTYIPEDPPLDRATLTMRYQRLATRRSPEGDALWLNWAVQRQQERDYIGVAQATVTADQPAYLAYLLAPAFWGYGYAQETCARVLRLLFDMYRVPAVQAEVDTRNQASWTLLERLGFSRTVLRPAADYFKGSSSDEYSYDLTEEAWRHRPGSHKAIVRPSIEM
jgi:RimJ/RimL family protein N-acetyltransferase